MKKKRTRLTNQEALFLGLDPKDREKYCKDRNPRYMLDEEQLFNLKKYRSNQINFKNEKSKELKTIRKNKIENTLLDVKALTVQEDSSGNTTQRWIKYDKLLSKRIEAFENIIESLKEDIEPVPPALVPEHNSNSNLLNQYTLTDYHLGMMSWGEETGADWNTKIAEDTLVKFFQTAIEQSPIAENAIFANIGDFLHWDGLDAVTPANKHVLDADTRFTKLVRVAINVIRRIISMLLDKYKNVYVIMAEGNHDPASSVWLRELLNTFYENEPRININTNPDPYYCVEHGLCFLGYHHGHKSNINKIESVLISKYKNEFGKSKFTYIHTGHLHHQKVVETNLSIIEQHNTLSAKDSYASRGGWNSQRNAKVITYHKLYGEVGRNTINIKMIS